MRLRPRRGGCGAWRLTPPLRLRAAANAEDVAAAKASGTADALLARLHLTPAKLAQLAGAHSTLIRRFLSPFHAAFALLSPPLRLALVPAPRADACATHAAGARAIAAQPEPIGKALSRMEVAPGLELTRVAAPLGVLLVIFEARPDALPQIACLAIRAGDGLLLKGGREALRSNAALHAVVADAVAAAPGVGRGLVAQVTSRGAIDDLLQLVRDGVRAGIRRGPLIEMHCCGRAG